ncbi:hypothetical protein [Jatrophihabitans sp.]
MVLTLMVVLAIAGQLLAIVGQSGSGKSMSMLTSIQVAFVS